MVNNVDGYKILNEIASVVSQSLDLNEVLSSALEMALQAVNLETGGIYLLEKDLQELTIAVQKGFSPEVILAIDHLKIGEGFSGEVIKSGQPIVIDDIGKDSRLSRSIVKKEGYKSLAVVPLCSKGKTLGTLFLVSRELRDFDDDEITKEIENGKEGEITRLPFCF